MRVNYIQTKPTTRIIIDEMESKIRIMCVHILGFSPRTSMIPAIEAISQTTSLYYILCYYPVTKRM